MPNKTGSRRRERGGVLVEAAIVLPVVMLLFIGVVDFGRALRDAVSVADAAGVGASYGSLSNVHSASTGAMNDAAGNSAGDVNGVSATSDFYCDCPNAPASGPADPNAVSCSTASCPGYGYPRVYVRTKVESTFDSLLHYPGIPADFTIGRRVYMRVQ